MTIDSYCRMAPTWDDADWVAEHLIADTEQPEEDNPIGSTTSNRTEQTKHALWILECVPRGVITAAVRNLEQPLKQDLVNDFLNRGVPAQGFKSAGLDDAGNTRALSAMARLSGESIAGFYRAYAGTPQQAELITKVIEKTHPKNMVWAAKLIAHGDPKNPSRLQDRPADALAVARLLVRLTSEPASFAAVVNEMTDDELFDLEWVGYSVPFAGWALKLPTAQQEECEEIFVNVISAGTRNPQVLNRFLSAHEKVIDHTNAADRRGMEAPKPKP